MTQSKITTGLPEAINARTKPLKGHTAALDRLRTELRVYRDGDELSGPVAVLIVLRDKRGDIDARIKAILDGGEGTLYANDRDVRELHISRVVGDGPIEVFVFAFPAERRAYLAAVEAASMDWDDDSRAQHAQRGAQR